MKSEVKIDKTRKYEAYALRVGDRVDGANTATKIGSNFVSHLNLYKFRKINECLKLSYGIKFCEIFEKIPKVFEKIADFT